MAKKIVIINAVHDDYQDNVFELNNLLEDDWEIKVSNVFNDCIFYYELENLDY